MGDLDRSLFFYTSILGLTVAKRMDESGPFIETVMGLKGISVTTVKLSAQDGSLVELLFFHSHLPEAGHERTLYGKGISHIAFTVSNVETEYEKLEKMGVPFISPPQVSPDGYARVAFCKDPDGNFIELVEVLS